MLIRVHPFAAAVLKAWHDEGWKKFMDRERKPDDLIVPRNDGNAWAVGWSRQPDLNRRPTVYETVALPTELCRPERAQPLEIPLLFHARRHLARRRL